MEELEALNMLLRLIGSSPVNAIDTAHPDAANARATLDRIRKSTQKSGWWFNTDYSVTFQPDENKEIRIPKEVSTAVFNDRYVVRGKKLYDKYNQTFQFTDNVTANKTIRRLDWDDMPESVQLYCSYYAGAQFVRDEIEDQVKKSDLERDAGLAMLDVKKEHLEQGQYNVFNKPRVARARLSVMPYNRGSARFYGTPDR